MNKIVILRGMFYALLAAAPCVLAVDVVDSINIDYTEIMSVERISNRDRRVYRACFFNRNWITASYCPEEPYRYSCILKVPHNDGHIDEIRIMKARPIFHKLRRFYDNN